MPNLGPVSHWTAAGFANPARIVQSDMHVGGRGDMWTASFRQCKAGSQLISLHRWSTCSLWGPPAIGGLPAPPIWPEWLSPIRTPGHLRSAVPAIASLIGAKCVPTAVHDMVLHLSEGKG